MDTILNSIISYVKEKLSSDISRYNLSLCEVIVIPCFSYSILVRLKCAEKYPDEKINEIEAYFYKFLKDGIRVVILPVGVKINNEKLKQSVNVKYNKISEIKKYKISHVNPFQKEIENLARKINKEKNIDTNQTIFWEILYNFPENETCYNYVDAGSEEYEIAEKLTHIADYLTKKKIGLINFLK